MSMAIALAPVSWQRMAEGIENVTNRLERAANALRSQGIRYAVVDGNAVAAWVSRVDLVRMKLTSFRDKDRMHLRDLTSVGLLDESWPARFSPLLGQRLQRILDDPEG